MKVNCEAVRSLEQHESGEMRSLRCKECGARAFHSPEQLARHQSACAGQGDAAAHQAGGSA